MADPSSSTRDTVASLRRKLFHAPASELVAGADGDAIIGAVMELAVGAETALVFGLRDGSASMYFSTGGGAIGGQGDPRVRDAALRFVQLAEACVDDFEETAEHPTPAPGQVRFTILSPAGHQALEVAEAELKRGGHPLEQLFSAGHAIISEFLASRQRREEAPQAPAYLNLLLTALARGRGNPAVLREGERLPDPSDLTDDPTDLEWIAENRFDSDALDATSVIAQLGELADFRGWKRLRSRGAFRSRLASHGGEGFTEVVFDVRRSKANGRAALEVWRRSGG